MTLECGIRFLTDYLEGDHYFHTARPGHNLAAPAPSSRWCARPEDGVRSDAGDRQLNRHLLTCRSTNDPGAALNRLQNI